MKSKEAPVEQRIQPPRLNMATKGLNDSIHSFDQYFLLHLHEEIRFDSIEILIQTKTQRRNKTTKWYLIKFGVIFVGLILAFVLSELRVRMGLHELEEEEHIQLRSILATTGSEDEDTCPGIKGNTDADRCEFVRVKQKRQQPLVS